jgi:hypothetical protein
MSKYSEIQTTFSDPDLLLSALGTMGFKKVRNHVGDPQPLEGFRGDKRKDLADIIIPRREVGSSSNDIGFSRGADGTFSLIVSDYDQARYGVQTKWHRDLKFNYAEQNILRAAKRQGLRAIHTGKKLDNGKVEYKFLKA